ncbi:MAG: hypothetical protein AAF709_14415 [Pseudomonadota bacterium]
MIKGVFLGKTWHWALIIVASGLMWFCGSKRLHVIEFNVFVLSLIVGTALAVFAVLYFHKPGEQVTRDQLIAHDETGDESAGPIRE